MMLFEQIITKAKYVSILYNISICFSYYWLLCYFLLFFVIFYHYFSDHAHYGVDISALGLKKHKTSFLQTRPFYLSSAIYGLQSLLHGVLLSCCCLQQGLLIKGLLSADTLQLIADTAIIAIALHHVSAHIIPEIKV